MLKPISVKENRDVTAVLIMFATITVVRPVEVFEVKWSNTRALSRKKGRQTDMTAEDVLKADVV